MYQMEKCSFSYDGKSDLFSDLTLNVSMGSRIVLLGRNGSGKTTLVKVCGLVGRVCVREMTRMRCADARPPSAGHSRRGAPSSRAPHGALCAAPRRLAGHGADGGGAPPQAPPRRTQRGGGGQRTALAQALGLVRHQRQDGGGACLLCD